MTDWSGTDLYDSDSGEEFVYDSDNMDEQFSAERQRSCNSEDVYEYDVLSPQEIVQTMIEYIDDVTTVVELPATNARILLTNCKWDKEKLLELYFDRTNANIFEDANLVSPHRTFHHPKPNDSQSSSSESQANVLKPCGICLEIEPSLIWLSCCHMFCRSCWDQYLTCRVMEGVSDLIRCPAVNCNLVVDDKTILELISDPLVHRQFQKLISNSFVECNRLMRWCPAPNCGHAFRAKHVKQSAVKCSCGKQICFQCGENWHDPVRCYWLKRWIKKCDDDSETSNWISANTKECPKCRISIEKDGGCNHMICKNASCRMDFCWVCLGPWEPHGSSWYTCNRYDEADAKRARDAQDKSREALQRYLFYCNRYMNHMQSLKFEKQLYVKVRLKMEELQRLNMSWIEVQFLQTAVDVLCHCRQVLMYTYVFAFYLKKNNNSLIFEENQKDLEMATEELSQYLERDIASLSETADLKQQVQDKHRYCDSRCQVLLSHVHEGYESDYWIYHDQS